mgnify:CR=1 FL=1
MGNHDLVVGEVDEIELQDGFFDYFEKYNLKTSRIILPARLSEEERENEFLGNLKTFRNNLD